MRRRINLLLGKFFVAPPFFLRSHRWTVSPSSPNAARLQSPSPNLRRTKPRCFFISVWQGGIWSQTDDGVKLLFSLNLALFHPPPSPWQRRLKQGRHFLDFPLIRGYLGFMKAPPLHPLMTKRRRPALSSNDFAVDARYHRGVVEPHGPGPSSTLFWRGLAAHFQISNFS